MASSQMNPLTLPKTTALPIAPGGGGGANKDQLLADLRRQVPVPPPRPPSLGEN